MKYISVHCSTNDTSKRCFLNVAQIVSIHVHESPDGQLFGVWVFTVDGRYLEVIQAENNEFMHMLECEGMLD